MYIYKIIISNVFLVSSILIILVSLLFSTNTVYGLCITDDIVASPWSDPATWRKMNMSFPRVMSAVKITQPILLDIDTPNLYEVAISGRGMLIFKDAPHVSLTASFISVFAGGQLVVGTEECPYTNHTTITLTGYSESAMYNLSINGFNYGQKAIGIANGGTLELHGIQPQPAWLRLGANAYAGDSIITLESQVLWTVGNEIMIGSTDFDYEQTEFRVIVPCTSCMPNQIKLDAPLKYMHWGSITPEGVDQRAEVAMMSRNIVIQGRVEADHCVSNELVCHFFPNYTFGGHIMITNGFTNAHIDSVQLINMGQPHMISRYPIHFHMTGDVGINGGYKNPAYVKNTVIKKSYNRCIVIHACNGLLVQNNIAYDHIGHCYMLCDGIETNNIIDRNIGILTRSGLITPPDRNTEMCIKKTPTDYNGYPTNDHECNAVSTFWISNPYNILTNNIAGGSENAGIWYIFPEYPSGESFKLGVQFRIQPVYTQVLSFSNNTCHSNRKVGINIDDGLKLSIPSKTEPQQTLSIISIRYNPHSNFRNISSPLATSVFTGLNSYKNLWRGGWARGGNILFDRCTFSDNAISLTLASEGTYPNSLDVSQQVTNSLFVGESSNIGSYSGEIAPFIRGRTNPFGEGGKMPVRGFEIYDGPILVENCTFRSFRRIDSDRNMSAIGWYRFHDYQFSTLSYVKNLTFQDVDFAYYMNDFDHDGDKSQNILDIDSNYPTLVRNLPYYKIENCFEFNPLNILRCKEQLAYLYIYNQYPEKTRYNGQDPSMVVVRDYDIRSNLSLKGIPNHTPRNHFLVPVFKTRKYTIHFDKHPHPPQILIEAINWNQQDEMEIGVCIGINSVQSILAEKLIGYQVVKQLKPVDTREQLDYNSFYHDLFTGILFYRFRQDNQRWNMSIHPNEGSEKLRITLNQRAVVDVADCRTNEYNQIFQIFDDSLHYQFKDQSSGLKIVENSDLSYRGQTYLEMDFNVSNQIRFVCEPSHQRILSPAFSVFEFWYRKEVDTACFIEVRFIDGNGVASYAEYVEDHGIAKKDIWTPVRIPVSKFESRNSRFFGGIIIQFSTTDNDSSIYFDDIKLIYS